MGAAVFDSLFVDPATFERLTGWSMRPEGLCRGERCIPLAAENGRVDVRAFAERSSSALLHDAENGLWALGPESGGRALASASLPDLELPRVDGNPFRLSSLRGTKVLLVAWASW
jgi:hypothetical protein